MKTNVSIKFNSVEEYKEIENKLIELGYDIIEKYESEKGYISTYKDKVLIKMPHISHNVNLVYTYNTLQEFLNENEN